MSKVIHKCKSTQVGKEVYGIGRSQIREKLLEAGCSLLQVQLFFNDLDEHRQQNQQQSAMMMHEEFKGTDAVIAAGRKNRALGMIVSNLVLGPQKAMLESRLEFIVSVGDAREILYQANMGGQVLDLYKGRPPVDVSLVLQDVKRSLQKVKAAWAGFHQSRNERDADVVVRALHTLDGHLQKLLHDRPAFAAARQDLSDAQAELGHSSARSNFVAAHSRAKLHYESGLKKLEAAL